MGNVVLIPARVSFFMINFGFWVGSLWGDWVGEHFRFAEGYDYEQRTTWRETAVHINEIWFSLGWAAFLVVAIVWGLKKHNRFVTNTAIVFLAIHFYTQFHEFFGFNPGTLGIGRYFPAWPVPLVFTALTECRRQKPKICFPNHNLRNIVPAN